MSKGYLEMVGCLKRWLEYMEIYPLISIHKVWNMLGGYLEMVGDIWKYLSSCLYIKYGNMWRGFLKLVVRYVEIFTLIFIHEV